MDLGAKLYSHELTERRRASFENGLPHRLGEPELKP